MEKCIINCSITGAIHVPSMTPHLPITPEQIAKEAISAAIAGAATVHLHARNPLNGEPTMDVKLFQQFCREVHRQSDVVICITTGGAPTMTPEERMVAVRKFKPELASLNMGSMNIGLFPMKDRIQTYQFDWEEKYLDKSYDNVFKNTFYDQERILSIMKENGTKPEMECYDVGHIYTTAYWADKGVIKPPFWLQFIFGLMGGIGPDVDNLVLMKNIADRLFGRDYIFSVLGAGRNEFALATVGAILGGSVRVGLEDNLYVGKGQLATSNAELVSRMVRILDELSIDHATPEEARQMLKLKGKAGTDY